MIQVLEMTPEEIAEAKVKLSLGREMMMLGHSNRKLAANQEHLNRYRNQMMDKTLEPVEATEEQSQSSETPEANMLNGSLVLGNVTITPEKQEAPTPQTPVATPTVEPPAAEQPAKPEGMSTLAKLGMAAAIASGLGIPVGAGLAVSSLLDRPAAVAPANIDTDTDTVVDISAGRPIE